MSFPRLPSHWIQVGEARTPAGRALLHEQFHILRRQMPFVHAILFFSTLSGVVGYGIPSSAPWELKIAAPLCLLAVTVFRMFYWLRLQRVSLTAQEILEQFRKARIRAVLLSIGFSLWGLLLFEYADLAGQAYITVFICLSAMGCAYCLATLPSIAGLSLVLSALPMAVRLLVSGDSLLLCMGFNLFLVLALVIRMLNTYFEGIVESVRVRIEIIAERERARRAEAVAVAERSKAKEIADTDALTRLANRRALLACLDRLIAERGAETLGFGVAMLDLDGFKSINDSFGHRIGDTILIEVGKRLSEIAGPDAIVGRLGGDEFCVLLPALWSVRVVEQMGEKFCEALAAPFDLGSVTVRLSGSCGIALFPDAGDNAAQLIERADTALYNVKHTGRRGVALFSYDMENRLRRRTRIQQALRLPARQDDVDLVFQPIVGLRNSHLRSFEALARWKDDQLGPVSPVEFISVAEQAGFIGELTDKLFEKAIRQANTWPREVGLSFNLSAHQLCSPTIPLKLASLMSSHGFDPRRLEIELTETALLVDFRTARNTIELLRATGAKITLDDFGAGHSSIGYLRELAFDAVKIDGAIVEPIVQSVDSRALLKGILDLCSAIGAPCIAEKVETAAHVGILKELRCDYAQGFALATPMPASDVVRSISDFMPHQFSIPDENGVNISKAS